MPEAIPVRADAPSVMIVDDHPENLELLDSILREQGLRTSVFPSGALALRAAEMRAPDIVLLDINMPTMDGYEVCRRFKASPELRDTPVIFLSALAQPEDRVRGFEAGGVDFVGKPFNMVEVQARVATHLELQRARTSLRMKHLQLQSMMDLAAHAGAEERYTLLNAVARLAGAGPNRAPEELDRLQRICPTLLQYLRATGQQGAVLDETQSEILVRACVLHDLGMASVDDAILLKPGILDEDEKRAMQEHTRIGHELLSRMAEKAGDDPVLKTAADIARWHHERWDGGGYPDGLAGEDIPLAARIVAAADTYNALHSSRTYRGPRPAAFVLEEIRRAAGTQLDPDLAMALLSCHAALQEELALGG